MNFYAGSAILTVTGFLFLKTLLEWKEIPFEILTGGGKHILVSTKGNKPFLNDHCRKILVAHYDRVPGTPGANDKQRRGIHSAQTH